MICATYLQAVQPLKEQLPIERARMRLKIQIPSGSREELMALLQSRQATIESQDLGLSNNQVMTVSHVLDGAAILANHVVGHKSMPKHHSCIDLCHRLCHVCLSDSECDVELETFPSCQEPLPFKDSLQVAGVCLLRMGRFAEALNTDTSSCPCR